MSTIIITGSGGYLGSHLIDSLLRNTDCSISAMTSDPKTLEKKYLNTDRVRCYGNDCLWKRSLPVENADALVHLAFSRRFSTDHDIAQSIELSRYVFEAAREAGVMKVVYISTQGVYGNTPELRTAGKTPVAPAAVYTMAKYASEQVLWSVFSGCTDTHATALRLDSIAGNQKMLPIFVKNAVEKHKIHVVGGDQIFSFMDVQDAADGIVALLRTPAEKWKSVYNLGPNDRRYNIIQLAELTAQIAEEKGFGKTDITIEKKEIEQYAGMDSSEFLKDTGWTPAYDMKAVISRLFDEFLRNADKDK